MMHDFAITPRYTLFMDLPMVFTMHEGLRLTFAPELGARLGILPRHGAGNMEDLRLRNSTSSRYSGGPSHTSGSLVLRIHVWRHCVRHWNIS